MNGLPVAAALRNLRPRATGKSPLGLRVIAIGLLAIVAVVFPAFEGHDTFVMSVATQSLAYGLAVIALNMLVGFGGQISLGHAGLLAIGGYTGALLASHVSSLPVPLEVLAAGATTAVVGFLLGLPTGRLRGHYLAIATLGFGVAIPQIALNWTSLTQGRTGIVVPPPRIAGTVFPSPTEIYYFTLIFAVIVAILYVRPQGLFGVKETARL